MDESEIQETTGKAGPKPWRFTILHSLALFALFVILQGIFHQLIRNDTGLQVHELQWYHFGVQIGIAGVLTIAVGAYLLGFSLDSMLFDHLPKVDRIFSTVLATIGALILATELDLILRFLIPITTEKQELVKLVEQDWIGVLMVAVIVAPLTEEILFRGVIFEGLLQYYNPSVAILVSSLFFGIAHLDLFVSIETFLLAVFLSWMKLRTGSLMLCIFSHSVFNTTQVVAEKYLPKNATAVPLWLNALGLVLFVIGIAALRRSNEKEHEFQNIES